MSMMQEENCITDREEAKAACVALGNRLIEALHLDICPYEVVTEIKVSHLVEIHCRLLNLNFEEYIPTALPWKAIDDIILSLRQRFGNGTQFDHMDSMLVSAREPTHLFCLLQIYETILKFYSERGKTFNQPQIHDQTLLTISDHGNISNNSQSMTELDLQIEVVQNQTGDENIQIQQWQDTSRHHRILVNVPKLTDSPLSINNHNQADDENIQIQQWQETSRPHPALVNVPKLTESPLSTNSQENDIPTPPLLPRKKEKRNKKGNTSEMSKRAKDVRDESSHGHERPTISILDTKVLRRTKKALKSKDKEKNSPLRESTVIKDEADAEDFQKQLMKFHKEIEEQVRNELYILEEEMKSHESEDACPNLPQQKVKYDVFGKRIRERFPYYPNGIIRPRCSSSSQPFRQQSLKNARHIENVQVKSTSKNLCDFLHALSDGSGEDLKDEDGGREVGDNESLTFAGQILERILAQHPQCSFMPRQLESLRRTCEEYIKLFDKANLQEEEIRTKVQEKMEILFRLANEKVNFLSSSESKQTQSSHIRSTAKTIGEERRGKTKKSIASVMNKKLESGRHKKMKANIIPPPTLSLPETKINEEVDSQVLHLEKEYLNILTAFRLDSQRLKRNATLLPEEKEVRYKELWNDYRLRIKAAIDLCVDKIVARIGLLYVK